MPGSGVGRHGRLLPSQHPSRRAGGAPGESANRHREQARGTESQGDMAPAATWEVAPAPENSPSGTVPARRARLRPATIASGRQASPCRRSLTLPGTTSPAAAIATVHLPGPSSGDACRNNCGRAPARETARKSFSRRIVCLRQSSASAWCSLPRSENAGTARCEDPTVSAVVVVRSARVEEIEAMARVIVRSW